tara:strand:+ start:443 stop:706 length:264 start_codon:yes stop_codon:yes gene_type:complete
MITIYGKPQCGFCTKAKALADSYSMEYVYKDVTNSVEIMSEMKDRAGTVVIKTVPQIFIRNEYIGGYTQFAKYIEETGYTGRADHSL